MWLSSCRLRAWPRDKGWVRISRWRLHRRGRKRHVAGEVDAATIRFFHRQLGRSPGLGPEAVGLRAGMAQDESGIAIDSSIEENAGRVAERRPTRPHHDLAIDHGVEAIRRVARCDDAKPNLIAELLNWGMIAPVSGPKRTMGLAEAGQRRYLLHGASHFAPPGSQPGGFSFGSCWMSWRGSGRCPRRQPFGEITRGAAAPAL